MMMKGFSIYKGSDGKRMRGFYFKSENGSFFAGNFSNNSFIPILLELQVFKSQLNTMTSCDHFCRACFPS